ncbi:MAG: acetylxylan esterase [Akkermansiaceae bacterium]|nr:acetylxylan esterase [Akkermansiaceae bacterium]
MSAGAAEKKFVPNYDEAQVPAYELADPLAPGGGGKAATAAEWEESGRPRTLELFRTHVYGRVPAGDAPKLTWTVAKENTEALGGTAVRREYLVRFGTEGGPEIRMLLYVPKKAAGPSPAFLGLNFRGNQLVEPDPDITMEDGYIIGRGQAVKDHRATEASRGDGATRWPAKMLVERGYALATACCGDIDPDFDDGFKNGVHGMFPGERTGDSWGTVAGWAWGLSRLLDVLGEIEEVDAGRVAVIGHSRLGKTALWAGANDERFAMVISNNSGCGGAALSKRAVGETVGRINTSFPHWFCTNFRRYNENEGELPVDQHQLIALIAPRPVYVASATGDRWADPKGEFLALRHAAPVYALYHDDPLGVDEQPAPGRPAGRVMRYHLRTGRHDITEWDWRHYLDFADRWMPVKQ